ncbi:MAG: hypothetical protein OMM_04007 [Candidatus Magnetoglobus multicellularis str. Araruama]|uniref:Thiamine pyrimidine synthase n=1 Tax=Candidatus Magnetoglobus multicellularis str. Araruama TaxID=890399 RepID=A0A1V1P3C6_9BACT|nr:MAG: hypothetical protein OMM_04007 [Candidatus Magnetoglobus multicellularis str. Araruama]
MVPSISICRILCSHRKGFYEQEGLQVVLKERNTQKSHIQSVIDEEAEYGVADAGLLLGRMLGKPVVLLKQIFQHSPLVFIALKSSNILSPFDMYGQKVMMDIEGHSIIPLIALIHDTIGNTKALTTTRHSFNIEDLISGKVNFFLILMAMMAWACQKSVFQVQVQSYWSITCFMCDIVIRTVIQMMRHHGRNGQGLPIQGLKNIFRNWLKVGSSV